MGDKPKLVLLTGGNSGLGLEACKILCARGYTVVATVRSNEKGEDMKAEVKAVTPNADINYMLCEMSDPKSIRAFVEEFKSIWLADERRLDLLINNAGLSFTSDEKVVAEVNPEWEKTMVVNALAPIYLTDLLLDNLKQTAEEKREARIVMVNSSTTTDLEWLSKAKIDMDDVMMTKAETYKHGFVSYKLSKMALMMATLAMVDELEGTNVKVNSMCPGLIPGTNLGFANTPQSRMQRMKCTVCCVGCLFGKSVKAGGQYIVDVADGERGATQGVFYVRGVVRAPHPQVQEKENQSKMIALLRELARSV